MTAMSLAISYHHDLARFNCIQPRYNLLYREIESELVPLCLNQGIGIIAYNPLAGGFLSGKYQTGDAPVPGTRFTMGKTGDLYRERYWQQAQFEAVEHLKKALPRGRSLVQVAVAWVLAQPGITSAIVGASKPEQLDESLAAVDLVLTPEEREACNLAWFSLPRPMQPPR
jgi:aryl-alcohol dehydrogenase-like predicted oxidoreductase